MRKLTGLLATATVLVPAAVLAQTASPPTPWEDVPPVALDAPGQPLPSSVPFPPRAAPPGVTWHRDSAPPPPASPREAQARHDVPAPIQFREAAPSAHSPDRTHDHGEGGSHQEEAQHRGDWHFDREACRPLPDHRYECHDSHSTADPYAYPYDHGYPGYGYGGTVIVTETIVTSGPGVTVRTYHDETGTRPHPVPVTKAAPPSSDKKI